MYLPYIYFNIKYKGPYLILFEGTPKLHYLIYCQHIKLSILPCTNGIDIKFVHICIGCNHKISRKNKTGKMVLR